MSVLKDRRRVLGPTDSVPVLLHDAVERKESDRMRAQDELRKLFIQRGIVANATGSAYLEAEGGDIRLQCSVNGPKPIRGSFTTRADLAVEVQFSKVRTSNKDEDMESKLSKSFASFLQTAITPAIMLDLYPKSAITVLISVISPVKGNVKSLLAAATACASVALTDAGISMNDLVTAGSVLLSDSQVFNDPECEPQNDDVDAVVSYMCANNNQISSIWVDGAQMQQDHMDAILKHSKHIATQVRQLINGQLVNDLKE